MEYVAIASTVFSAVGAISSANSQANAYKSQAEWNTYNAAISRQNADAALQQSAAQQEQQNRSARRMLGEQRAGVAQSGTGFGGSNLDILDQSQTLAELDMLNIAYEGQMRARGHTIQAGAEEFSAKTNRSNVRNAMVSGAFGVGKSLLTGYSNYQNVKSVKK